jgi:aspartyl-tRNA(Asn)/glutamyl-tRNA(Gln) amidotransferase subunit A
VTTTDAATVTGESLTIVAAGARLRCGELTCVELATSQLERIAALDPSLHAYIEVTGDDALRQAESLDAELAAGIDRGPLHGIPFAVKDLFDVAGVRTTVGSRSRANAATANADAAVVGRLRAAGAVFMGKNNLAEFAADMTGRNETFGDMGNPWNRDYSAGGSSGGTASAVAAGMSLGGIGSDTGGSIRFPASVCGVVGVRPTYGAVDVAGAFARAPTLDAVGPIARTVDDAAVLLSAMTGRYAAADPDVSVVGLEGVRVGLIENVSLVGLDPGVERPVREAVHALTELGATIRGVRIPAFDTLLDSQRLFDVLLYEFHRAMGERAESAGDRRLFGSAVRDDLDRGAAVNRDSYERALAGRTALQSRVAATFGSVDVLVTPTQPVEPPRLEAGPEELERVRRFLLPTSFLGLPSVSVPCGLSDNGLPVGLHVVGGYGDEAGILRVARAVEYSVGWQCRPAQRDVLR